MTFPTSTLSKFGVPLADATKVGILQPKPKYRFRVLVTNFGPATEQYELTRNVMTVGKPKINQDPVEVHSYNSVAYYAGKHAWQTIDLVVRDDVSNRVTRLVGYQLQKQINHFEQTGFVAGINYKFNMSIEVMDGGNTKIIEQWSIEGAYISACNFADLDYSSSDPQDITMTIRYDNAVYFGEDGAEVTMPDAVLPSIGPNDAVTNPFLG